MATPHNQVVYIIGRSGHSTKRLAPALGLEVNMGSLMIDVMALHAMGYDSAINDHRVRRNYDSH